MKTKRIIIALVAVFVLTIAMPTDAGATPPPWAPAHGYRAKTRQIYFPQQNMYYDLNRGTYIYLNGRNWSASVALPVMYRNVNLRVVPQVELMLNTNRPYIYNRVHRIRYRGYGDYDNYYDRRMEKNERDYYKDQRKAQKRYEKAYKNYYKQNRKHQERWDD